MTLRTAALAGIAVAIIVAACGSGDDDSSELSIAQWAAQTCAAGRLTADAFSGIDPSKLTLDTRKERADEMARIFDDALLTLNAIDPPASVKDYHQAVIDGVEYVAAAYTRAFASIDDTDSDVDVESIKEKIEIAELRAAADVQDEYEDLPNDAITELRGVTNCS